MTRIVIIDHAEHTVHIEDIDSAVLNAEPYNGDEQTYIDKNYTFEGDYSWDYIVDAEYIGPKSGPYDLGEKIDELYEEDIDT